MSYEIFYEKDSFLNYFENIVLWELLYFNILNMKINLLVK